MLTIAEWIELTDDTMLQAIVTLAHIDEDESLYEGVVTAMGWLEHHTCDHITGTSMSCGQAIFHMQELYHISLHQARAFYDGGVAG